MVKIGFCSVTFRQLNVSEVIDVAKNAGAEGIEWGGDVHVTDTQTAQCVAEKMKKEGLLTFSYGSYYKCEGTEKEMERLINIAAILGAKNIRVWAGTKSPKDVTNEERQKIADNLKRFCDMADKYGINISLEYHRNTLTENVESAIGLIKDVAKQNLKCQWQANPDISFKENCAELSKLLSVGDHFGNVHIFNMQRDNSFRSLSEIEDNLCQYHKIMSGTGKNRLYILEFCKGNRTEEFYKDMQVLKKIVKD